MSRTPFRLGKLATTICLLSGSIALPSTAYAQDDDVLELEEIVVTAQKRQESLQDVPISVAAVSAERLEETGVDDIEGLTTLMPNIHFTQTGISTQVRVRGIGSDNSQGFEQSVGMYVDGIYYGRAQLFRVPMMDMERAELLRGPQGTLFGKNSIAGALNLTTAKPTDELMGRFSVSHEFEHNQNEFNGVISGPLTDELLGRLAVRTYDEDGYVYNSFLDRGEGEQQNFSIRGTLDYAASDQLSFSLKAEHNSFETRGRAIELTQDVGFGGNPGNYASVLAGFGVIPAEDFDTDLDFVRQSNEDEFSNNTVNNYTLTTTYDLDNDHTITAVTGYLSFDYNELCDCDFTPAEILELELNEDYEQASQEIRITSPQDQDIEWLAGAFYQEYEQNFDDLINVHAASDTETGNLLPLFPVTDASGVPIPNSSYASLLNTGPQRTFFQDSKAAALFARATWHINDVLHLTVGGRYAWERKTAEKSIDVIGIDGVSPSAAELEEAGRLYEVPALLAINNNSPGNDPDAGVFKHRLDESRSEKVFTPLVNLEYNATDDIMLYASYTQGYKAFGFDPRSNNPAFFAFDEERADAFEIGMKSTLLDGRAELNAALYHTNYEDLQISQYDGAVGFNVGNAEETVVQGIELDGRVLITEELSASFGGSYLDFEYKDFENGNCYAGQEVDNRVTLQITDNPADSIEVSQCDYTGQRGVYTPDFTLNFALNYERPVSDDIMFDALVDVQHVDSHNVHVNLDPDGEIDSYQLVTLRLGLSTETWELALLGRNMLDEEIRSYSGPVTLSDSQLSTDTEYSFVRRPRSIALQGVYKF